MLRLISLFASGVIMGALFGVAIMCLVSVAKGNDDE